MKPKIRVNEDECSICAMSMAAEAKRKNKQWTFGNNAEPVNDGRCCDYCNDTVVIPMRLHRIGVATRGVA